jgi:flagellar FliL protein
MSAQPETPADHAIPVKKKGKGKLFVILGAVLVLLGGGGAAAYFTLRAPAGVSAKTEAAPEKKKPEPSGIVNFEPFVVNLADTGGRRFLRINVRLLVPEPEEAEHIQKSDVSLMRLRSEIIELLTEQTSEQIVTADGKAALKAAIVAHTTPIVAPTEVSDVLFSDFVVQY